MQLINTVGPADHLPLSVQIRCIMSFHVEKKTEKISFYKQKLMQCVLNGHGREEFVADVEAS
eukprot:13387883-Heterocapsa_arctica.AAC.1